MVFQDVMFLHLQARLSTACLIIVVDVFYGFWASTGV